MVTDAPTRYKRQVARSSRYRLKAAQRKLTSSVSSRLCGYAAEAEVAVAVGGLGVAHIGGITRCGSPWSCATCAPVVRQHRAEEIDAGLGAHLAAGGSGLFVTLTVRHARGDELAGRLDLVSGALGRCLSGKPWRRRKRLLGYIGAIRVVEITDGANGWHPHVHAAVLFDRTLTALEVAEFGDWLYARWHGIVERKGFGSVTRAHGVDVRRIEAASELADYLAKVEGGWGAGLELARSDVKRARVGGRTPGAILVELVELGREGAGTDRAQLLRARWVEYEAATLGKRAIVWSAGLRARLLGSVPEQSDVEAAAGPDPDAIVLVVHYPAAIWNVYARKGLVGDVLAEVELRAASGEAGYASWAPPPPLAA